jgi:hypothetical protein
MFTNNNQKKLTLFLIIIIGLVLRWLFPLDRLFDFDQNQIAEFSKQIIEKNLTLIGPRTGPLQFFTGPLIYYLGAIIYKLTNLHPIANTYISLSIYLLTIFSLLIIFKNKFTFFFRTTFIALYSLSPYFIQLDRVTWNPNLSFLSGSLVLMSLLYYQKQNPLKSYAFGFLGMFLAYQAHFSGFIMLVIALILSLIFHKSIKFIVSTISGLLISLSSLIIFDLRNNWLNLRGLLAMLSNSEQVGKVSLFARLYKNITITLENLGKILIYNSNFISLSLIGLIILTVWFKSESKFLTKKQKSITLLWSILFAILFALYRGQTPEYYFLMQPPAFCIVIADLLSKYHKKISHMFYYQAYYLQFRWEQSYPLVLQTV